MTMKLASFSQTDEPKAFMSPGAHKGVVGCVVTCWYEVRAPETGEQPKDRMWNLQAALLGPLEGGCSTVRQEQTSFRPRASGVSADSFVFMQLRQSAGIKSRMNQKLSGCPCRCRASQSSALRTE